MKKLIIFLFLVFWFIVLPLFLNQFGLGFLPYLIAAMTLPFWGLGVVIALDQGKETF